MPLRKIINILSITVIVGFTAGIIASIYFKIIPNKYFQHKMYKLIILTIQENLNKWIIISLFASIAILMSLLIARMVWQLLLVNILDINVKNKKQLKYLLIGCIFFLLFFCFGGWVIGHFYSSIPSNWICITGLAASVVCVGFLLSYIKHINKIALAFFFLTLIINTYVLIDGKINPPKGPNVILISIDTLRADHLGCYGYIRNTSPHIDSFAKKNILFKKCIVQDDLTLPSHMSILTSLYPIKHAVNEKKSLNPSVNTLAEVLKNIGYHTMGFVRHCIWMNAEYGFDQGFNSYIVKDYNPKNPELNAEFQNIFISKYLQKYNKKKFFLFIHYYDVHSDFNRLPYDAPSQYKDIFYPDYNGDFKGGFSDIVASKYLTYVNNYRIKIKEDDLKYIESLYDSGIAYTDKCIGDLFRTLQDNGLYENSLIILTADHGEEFQEHAYMLHGNNLFYDEIMHVPLIVKMPGRIDKQKEFDELIESIDIMPTILDILDIDKNSQSQGESFLGLINGEKKWKKHVFAFGSHGKALIRNERWKLLTDNILRKDGFKLFDLSEFPLENIDIKGRYSEIAEVLHNKLIEKYNLVKFARVKEKDFSQKVILNEENLKKIRSLGYVK